MVHDIFTPMNHREIEYNAKKLSGCDIPDSPVYDKSLLEWLDETGERVFDENLVMDYGTDCLRLYLLFENTPRENDVPCYDSWQEGALEGIYKFLGRYRRMVLTADEWNRRGNYTGEIFSVEGIDKINQALETAVTRIKKCVSRGNTMSNRHNIVASWMELLNVYQKELKIGEIMGILRNQAIERAVPHGGTGTDLKHGQSDNRSYDVTQLCQRFIILLTPYAPDLSKILWVSIQ